MLIKYEFDNAFKHLCNFLISKSELMAFMTGG